MGENFDTCLVNEDSTKIVKWTNNFSDLDVFDIFLFDGMHQKIIGVKWENYPKVCGDSLILSKIHQIFACY